MKILFWTCFLGVVRNGFTSVSCRILYSGRNGEICCVNDSDSPGVFKVLHFNEKQPCESDIWQRSSEIAHGQLPTVCLLVISPTELSHTGVVFYLWVTVLSCTGTCSEQAQILGSEHLVVRPICTILFPFGELLYHTGCKSHIGLHFTVKYCFANFIFFSR